MTNSKKGDVGEHFAIAKLTSQGFTVSKTVSEDCQYDILVDDGEEIHKVQVKTAKLEDDKIEAWLKSPSPRSDGYEWREYQEHRVDAFAVYCPETQEIYWIWFDEAPKTSITLRKSSKKKDKRIRWADEHRVSEKINPNI
jgi:hypothetical protein